VGLPGLAGNSIQRASKDIKVYLKGKYFLLKKHLKALVALSVDP